MTAHSVTILGTGGISRLYAEAITSGRSRDRVGCVYGRSEAKARTFATPYDAGWTTSLETAVRHPETDVVVIGLPNGLHEEAVRLSAAAGKAVLCTKPLGRTAAESRRMLELVEGHGVLGGYLEDLSYTTRTVAAVRSVRAGAVGRPLWVRSRIAHDGPPTAWFYAASAAEGGGALLDLGCHAIEVVRGFVGKGDRPVEVLCSLTADVHPIDADDTAIALIRFASGALGQVEASWTAQGGMDLRDEIAGTTGTIRLDHFQRMGVERYSGGEGWSFPVADESEALGFGAMFADMFEAIDEGRAPVESFYDGYVVSEVMDACLRSGASRRWEQITIGDWRGGAPAPPAEDPPLHEGQIVVRDRPTPEGGRQLVLKDPVSGVFTDRTLPPL